jgi:hypothetical protein
VKVVAHKPVPSTLYGAIARYFIPELPAMNGASARTSPMKRPIRIVLPPCLSKYDSTCANRSFVIRSLSPCLRMNPRPSLSPRR